MSARVGWHPRSAGASTPAARSGVMATGLLAAALCLLLTTAAQAQGVAGAINTPASGATVMQPFTITGWAIHGPGSGTGIDVVRIYECSGACVLWGTATYGVARPDVAAVYGSPYLNSGYTFTKAGLTPGTYYLKVEAHSTITGAWYLWGHWFTTQAGPEHTLELPTHGASVTSPVGVQGWAIDGSAPSGTGVSAVNLFSHPNAYSGQPLIVLGASTYGVNRPDVAASHGERFRYTGYTASLASLPAGAHYFGALAVSSHSGALTWRGITMYVDSPTVGLTIDRPGTGTGGVTASGLSCPGGSDKQAVPCGATYPLHTVVTLTADPDVNSTFAGWGGSCTGSGTCQVTLSQARFVTASFTKLPDSVDLRYYHTDAIGSVRAITDEEGDVVARNDYRPFGEDTEPLTGDPNRFAGKQLDAETALHYFDARYYRQTWGRFTSVDPLHVGAAMTDPQQWNRYAYARNNPLKYGDPTGLCANILIDGTTYCVSESVEVSGTIDVILTDNGWECWSGGRPCTYVDFETSDWMLPGGGGGGGGDGGGGGGGAGWNDQGGGVLVPTAGTTADTVTTPPTTQGPVVHGADDDVAVVTDALDRTKNRIARIGSCLAIFDGGADTAADIMNATSYHVLASGPSAAWVGGDFTIHINRSVFSSGARGGFETLRGVTFLDGPAKQEAVLVHETLHQAHRLGRLAPGVRFGPDSQSADPNFPRQQRLNNGVVLDNCFPGSN